MHAARVELRSEKPRSLAGRTITVVLMGVAVMVAVRVFRETDRSALENPALAPLSHAQEFEMLGGKIETFDDDSLRVTCHDARDAIVPQILHLENVVSVNLSRSPASEEALIQLAGIPGLKALRLADTRLTDAGLGQLAVLTQLESLDLSGTQITGSGLTHLASFSNLRALYLDRTRIGDAGLEHFKELRQLQLLDLRGSDVTERAVAELQSALSGCKITF